MKAPGSSPAELLCLSPAGLAEYLRGNIKSCFEDLQDTSGIYGSIPEPPWGPSNLNFSWRKFGIKKVRDIQLGQVIVPELKIKSLCTLC